MISHELTQLKRWVCCGVDPENPKKPYTPRTMQPAKAGEPATWGSFEEAVQRVTESKAQVVGFEFDGNDYTGLDLDQCRDSVTGVVKSWAADIVQGFDSLTEISWSGTGLHIIIRGQKPGQQCRKTLDKATGEGIEIYSDARYFVMTGNVYHDKPIAERTAELKALYDRLWPPQQQAQPPTAPTQNIDYLPIGLEKDQKLKSYWHGARPHGNESEDDAGFMAKLMYWCNNDTDRAIQAFRFSPYVGQKDEVHKRKLDRHDYLPNLARAMMCERTAAQDNEKWQREHAPRQESTQGKASLNIVSAPELQAADIPPTKFLVDDFLPEGASILASAPKIGKSWFVLLMGLKIALGEKFMNWQTPKPECCICPLRTRGSVYRSG